MNQPLLDLRNEEEEEKVAGLLLRQKIVSSVSLDEEEGYRGPLQLDTEPETPARLQSKEPFFYVETDKRVYYPGETMEVAMHLRLTKTLERVDQLNLHAKGTESFKFNSKVKTQRSLHNRRTIISQGYGVCRFMPSELPKGDYTFMFKFKIPYLDNNAQQQGGTHQWPASFHMKRDVKDKGELKLHTKYRIQAQIVPIGGGPPVLKCRRRFFLAKKPFNPRLNFIEMGQQEVTRCCSIAGEGKCLWLCSAGINAIRVKFDRNFYLSNELFKARCFVDNTRSTAKCEKILVRLIRTIKCYGTVQGAQPNPNNNPRLPLYPFEENRVIASQDFTINVPAGQKQADYSQTIQMFLDDVLAPDASAQGDMYFKKTRNPPTKKPYKAEDLTFATRSMQPSTVGQIFNCLYTVVINRSIQGFSNYPTGVSVLITVNPCMEQVSGDLEGDSRRPPFNWNPKVVDLLSQPPVNQVLPGGGAAGNHIVNVDTLQYLLSNQATSFKKQATPQAQEEEVLDDDYDATNA